MLTLPADMRGDIAYRGTIELPWTAGDSGMVMSADELHRYLLWWVWDWTLPLWLFLMLNPSKATHQRTDPTVARQAERVRRHGGGGVIVGNAGALRETDRLVALKHPEIIGPDNQFWLSHATTLADKIIVAHGPDACKFGGDKLIRRATEGHQLFALKITAGGHPGHPLYIGYDAPLLPFEYPL
jgi:hypothetical protein